MANFWDRLNNLVKRKITRRRVPTSVPYGQTGPGFYASQVFGSKLATSIYEHNLQSTADRLARIRDYDAMDTTPIVSTALNVYADDASSYGEDGQVLTISCDNQKMLEDIEYLFYDILNVDFNIYHQIRTLCKYGDKFELLSIEKGKGVTGTIALPTAEIEREEAYDGDPTSVRFRWVAQTGAAYNEFQVAHFRLMGDDNFLPYGRSVLESGRGIWKKLQLLEDAMLIYRISRAAEKRVFQIEVGNIPFDQIENYIEQQRAKIKTETVINPSTGEIDLRYRVSALTDDYWLAKRGDMMSTIETLPGGNNLNDIDDVEYIKQQLITSLGVPKAFLQFEDDLEGKSSASKVDMRFARSIQRIQKIMISEFTKIAILHLFAKEKYEENEIFNFELKMHNPSAIMELGKLEIMEKRFDIYNKAVNDSKAISMTRAKKEILDMTDDDLSKENKQLMVDAKFSAKIQKAADPQTEEAPQQEGGGDATGESAPEEGKDNLSDMLDSLEADSIGGEANPSIKQSDKGELKTGSDYDLAGDSLNSGIEPNSEKDFLFENVFSKGGKLKLVDFLNQTKESNQNEDKEDDEQS